MVNSVSLKKNNSMQASAHCEQEWYNLTNVAKITFDFAIIPVDFNVVFQYIILGI